LKKSRIEPRRVIAEFVEQISDDSTGQSPHADLHEDMGGPEACQGHLVHCLDAHGHLPLHDPKGNLCVAFPSRVLDHIPAVFFRHTAGQTDGVVIVDVGYNHGRPVGA
jgi:hypothetical protein